MSPEVFDLFERLLAPRAPVGPVLEIGATRDVDTLLNLPCLGDVSDRIGINAADPGTGEARILQMNANDLGAFRDGQFGLVLCNSVLEHDAQFWKSVAEAKRVTASGGLVVIGVPGYRGMGLHNLLRANRPLRLLQRLLPARLRPALAASTLTLGEHFYPDDYYRFSRQAVREVFMAGLNDVEVHEIMTPPRFVGLGVKP